MKRAGEGLGGSTGGAKSASLKMFPTGPLNHHSTSEFMHHKKQPSPFIHFLLDT